MTIDPVPMSGNALAPHASCAGRVVRPGCCEQGVDDGDVASVDA